MRPFETWLVQNSSQMASVENAVRSLTLFAPGQNNNVELISEAAAGILQGFGIYHDNLIAQVLSEKGLELSQHAKYLQAVTKESPAFRNVAGVLAGVRCSELFLEMLARNKGGEKARWQAVWAIEATKAALRLSLLAIADRPLPYPVYFEREMEPAAIEKIVTPVELELELEDEGGADGANGADGADGADAKIVPAEPSLQVLPRSGKAFPNATFTASLDRARAAMAGKLLKPELMRPPVQLLRRLSKRLLLGEVLTILRPLVYAILAYRFRKRRSWTPWLLGLAMEFVARQLSAQGYNAGGRSRVTTVELEQLKRKTSSLWWWMLRGNMYETVTRPAVASVAGKFSKLPVLSFGSVLIDDYLYLLDTYYFSSASI